MDANEFIRHSIDRGQREGVHALRDLQRTIFLVSELEVLCDKDGIDAFLDAYGAAELRTIAELLDAAGAAAIAEGLSQIADSLSHPDDALLTRVSDLVSDRVGYDYDALNRVVAARLTATR